MHPRQQATAEKIDTVDRDREQTAGCKTKPKVITTVGRGQDGVMRRSRGTCVRRRSGRPISQGRTARTPSAGPWDATPEILLYALREEGW